MPSTDVTQVLEALRRGEPGAAERLMPLVYEQLRALAGSYFRRQPAGHTLQPTALVHEAYLRLVGQESGAWQDRAHFVAVCALAMRSILTDHARRKAADKRGGGWRRVTLSGVDTPSSQTERVVDTIALDDALEELARLNERQSRIATFRLFGGLSNQDIAQHIGVSLSTVESDWAMARAWLSVRLKPADG